MSRSMKLRSQRGATLIESLIAILLFSIGVLAIIGMYANAVAISTDAQYRLEATNHAHRILNRMLAEANYAGAAELAASLENYVHNPETDGPCDFGGDESEHDAVKQWAESIMKAGSGLPGVKSSFLQITFDSDANNLVTVTVCWQAPSDKEPRRETVAMNINSVM